MDRGKLYHDLYEAYKKTMNYRSARESQEAAIATWNSIKSEATDKGELERLIKEKTIELEQQARKKKASLMSFWCNIPIKKNLESEGVVISSSSKKEVQATAPAPGLRDTQLRIFTHIKFII